MKALFAIAVQSRGLHVSVNGIRKGQRRFHGEVD